MGSASSLLREGDFHGVMISTEREQQKGKHPKTYSQAVVDQVNSVIERSVSKISKSSLFKPVRELEKLQVLDSVFVKRWLDLGEIDELFLYFLDVGEKMHPLDTSSAMKGKSRYPLWSKYYGCAREVDGALALDRWGSNYESFTKVEQPPAVLLKYAAKLRKDFSLKTECSINSFLVNFYYNGSDTYIPAHRDTTACLEADSSIFCLSLGATRDFLLCDNQDLGKFKTEEMKVRHSYKVQSGDVFSLGPQTNEEYLHAVPQDRSVQGVRISIIFRSIDKSFIDKDSVSKVVSYADGKVKLFTAECITAKSYDDKGRREHISHLIAQREDRKAAKMKTTAKEISKEEGRESIDKQGVDCEGVRTRTTSFNSEDSPSSSMVIDPETEDLGKYYQGFGSTVPQ